MSKEILLESEDIEIMSKNANELKKQLLEEVKRPEYEGQLDSILELCKLIEEEISQAKGKTLGLREQIKLLAYSNLMETWFGNLDDEMDDEDEEFDFDDEDLEFEDDEK